MIGASALFAYLKSEMQTFANGVEEGDRYRRGLPALHPEIRETWQGNRPEEGDTPPPKTTLAQLRQASLNQ